MACLDVCVPGGGAGGSAGTPRCWRDGRERGAESVRGGAEGVGERQGAGESGRPTLASHADAQLRLLPSSIDVD